MKWLLMLPLALVVLLFVVLMLRLAMVKVTQMRCDHETISRVRQIRNYEFYWVEICTKCGKVPRFKP